MGAAGVAATDPQPGSTYPARAATVPARRGLAGLSCRPARPAPRGPRLPLAAALGTRPTRPISAGKRGLETFFPPLGPGSARPSLGGGAGRGRRRCRSLAGKTGVERACPWLGPRRATHSGTPARLFTLVAFVCPCSCARIDKGAIGRRNPGIRNS